MRLLRALGRMLASPRLSLYMMATLALSYAVWVLPFQFYGTAPWRTRNIATGTYFLILGVVLAVNNVACIAKRVPTLLRSTRRAWSPDAEGARRLAGPAGSCRLHPDDACRLVVRLLRRHGYRVREAEGGVVAAVRGAWSPLATLALHLSLMLFAVAAVVGPAGFFRGKIVAVEGEAVDGSPASYSEPPAADLATMPSSAIPAPRFTVDLVRPAFWEDKQLFTELGALVTLPDGERREVAINAPFAADGAQVAIDGFGWAPEYRLVSPSGAEEGSFVKLKVFPPGAIDEFDLPGTPYRVRLSVFPDARVEDGSVVNRTLGLRDPVIAVSVEDVVSRGDADRLFKGLLRPGEPAAFAGYTLTFPSVRHYAELRVVRDPGAAWFLGGLALALVGGTWRFLGRRRRIVVVLEPTSEGATSWRYAASAEMWQGGHDVVARRLLTRALGEGRGVRDAGGEP